MNIFIIKWNLIMWFLPKTNCIAINILGHIPLQVYTCLSQVLWLFSCSVVSNSLRHHGLQHTRLPCPSLCPGVGWNSCPLSWWCYLTNSPSVSPFSSCFQSFPASGSFPMSRLFASGGQNIGASASASVLPRAFHVIYSVYKLVK